MDVCFEYNTNQSLMNQWDFVLCNFKPANIYLLVGDNVASMVMSNPLKTAQLIQSYAELPQKKRICMAPKHGQLIQGSVALSEFHHPDDAVYIFGSDSKPMDMFDYDVALYVDTDTTDDMYSFAAYAVTAWDRRMKLGNC